MPFCVSFLKTTVDVLVSLIGAAMTLVATLMDPGAESPTVTSVSLAALTLNAEQDVPDLIARLRDRDPSARAMAACELQHLGSTARPAIAALVERLSDPSPVDPQVCGEGRHYRTRDVEQQTTPGEEAAAALVAIGTAALEPLIAAARAPQWVARRNAVWALGALDDRRAIPPGLISLKDSEPPVRKVAAWALGALDANEAVPALIAALGDSDAGVRAQVAWALGAIRDQRAVDALINALKDADENVRSQSAWALGAIRDGRASSALTVALKDASAKVRRQAAWALGTIGR